MEREAGDLLRVSGDAAGWDASGLHAHLATLGMSVLTQFERTPIANTRSHSCVSLVVVMGEQAGASPQANRLGGAMWLMTSVGFFSVVRKRGETDLTVRARVRGDLEALEEKYLPTLGPIEAGGGSDYPYRARISSKGLADAVTRMVEDIDYSNFKDAVASRQGLERAHAYGEVWSILRKLTRKDRP